MSGVEEPRIVIFFEATSHPTSQSLLPSENSSRPGFLDVCQMRCKSEVPSHPDLVRLLACERNISNSLATLKDNPANCKR